MKAQVRILINRIIATMNSSNQSELLKLNNILHDFRVLCPEELSSTMKVSKKVSETLFPRSN